MKAIFKREFYSYFTSIIGYVFLAVLYLFGGVFFWTTCLYVGNADVSGVYANMLMIVLLLIPILTMRLLSEEFKQKTDQALFTAPIRTWSIAMGKYLSALAMYLIGILIIPVYSVIVSFYVMPDWAVVLGNFVGLFLIGAALIAIGLFISSITESQIVAAVVSYAVSIFILLIDGIATLFSNSVVYNILNYISFSQHFRNFTLGIFNVTDVVFFLSISVLFIFLTSRMLEKKRWN